MSREGPPSVRVVAGLATAILALWTASAVTLVGGRADHRRAEARQEPPSRDGTQVRGARSLARAPDPASSAQGPAGAAGASEPAAWTDARLPPARATDPTFPLSLALSPSCARPGQVITATVRTLRGAHIALMAVYADGSSSEAGRYVGPVGPDGSLRFPWTVPPKAPAGEGRVLLVAGHEQRNRSQQVSAPFLVAGPEGCR